MYTVLAPLLRPSEEASPLPSPSTHPRHQQRLQGPRRVRDAAREILALTKMNWNSTEGLGRYPITISFAKKVGLLMRELSDNWTRFSGRIDLERHDYGGLAAHIAEVCADMESEPALADLVSRARCFRSLISLTVHQEQQAASDRRIAELREQLNTLRAEIAECSARALN
jgi:hypothetical protein